MTRDDQIEVTEHLWIPMPDGTRLAARLWLPRNAKVEPVPALFEYIPYRKADIVRARDERNHPFFAAHGYASLRVDMRGSGDSDGVMADMYAAEELSDAREVIDWIAAQPWCDGQVGMFGTSWGGTASLQANVDAPDALKAVIAVCATHDRYEDDIHHKGGCLLTDTFEWGATLPAILAGPPTPNTGADWRAAWRRRLEATAFPVETWVQEEARGTYWRHGSVIHHAERLSRPILAIGGWSDRYSNSVMALVGARPDLTWGVVGPWGHHYPDHGHPGPAIGFQHLALQWWDAWLKAPEGTSGTALTRQPGRVSNDQGTPLKPIAVGSGDVMEPQAAHTGDAEDQSRPPAQSDPSSAPVTPGSSKSGPQATRESGPKWPKLRVWLREFEPPSDVIDERSGQWIESGPPDAHTAPLSLRLGPSGLGDDEGSGPWEVPSDLAIGRAAGDTGYFGRYGGLPLDQRDDDALSLCFDTEPLDADWILYGMAVVRVRVTAGSVQRQLSLRLNDVAPDGTSQRVTLSVRNLALDQNLDVIPASGPLDTEISVPFHTKAYRFRKGHRVRLALASSYWPIVWPSPALGGVRIERGALELPLLVGAPTPLTQPLPPPEDLPRVKTHRVVTAATLRRTSSTDAEGSLVSAWTQPYTEVAYLDTGTSFGSETSAMHRITQGDPTSATSTFTHRAVYRRPDGTAEVSAQVTAESDPTAYALSGHLTVRWEGEILFERDWRTSIPRTCS